MQERRSLQLEEKFRKEIYSFRVHRREERKKEEERLNKVKELGEKNPDLDDVLRRATQLAMEEMLPSYKEYVEQMNKAADSGWFAMSELERFQNHMEEQHGGDTNKCGITKGEKCLEDFTIEDAKEYTKTIMKDIREFYEEK